MQITRSVLGAKGQTDREVGAQSYGSSLKIARLPNPKCSSCDSYFLALSGKDRLPWFSSLCHVMLPAMVAVLFWTQGTLLNVQDPAATIKIAQVEETWEMTVGSLDSTIGSLQQLTRQCRHYHTSIPWAIS
jgi:hypothetical protein